MEQYQEIIKKIRNNFVADIQVGAKDVKDLSFVHRRGFDELLVSDYKAFAASLGIRISIERNNKYVDTFLIASNDVTKLAGLDLTDSSRAMALIGEVKEKPIAVEVEIKQETPEYILTVNHPPAKTSTAKKEGDRNFKKSGDSYSETETRRILGGRVLNFLGIDGEKGPIIDLGKYKEAFAMHLTTIDELNATMKADKGHFLKVIAHGDAAVKWLRENNIRVGGMKGYTPEQSNGYSK